MRMDSFISIRLHSTNAMGDTTSIKIDSGTRDRLRAAKRGGETYDKALNRILDEMEGQDD